MLLGNKTGIIPKIDWEIQALQAPGIDINLTEKLVNVINERMSIRQAPLYIFFNPDLQEYAQKLGSNVKDVYQCLIFLSGFFSQYVTMKVILDHDDLFYHLQDEDLVELKESNHLHHPEDPRIIYQNAQRLVRHAFVVGL